MLKNKRDLLIKSFCAALLLMKKYYICNMQMINHIQALLYRYECVVIPEFGAFLTQRQPAEIQEETQAFLPPRKTLSFNRQLQKNDGLLAGYVAKVEGFSYEQALKKIYEFVENLTTTLDAHQKVNLNHIGMFYVQDGKVLFQPDVHINYLTEAFGTAEFVTSSVQRKSAVVPVAELVVDTPEAVTMARPVKSRPAYWKYAAVGLVAVGLSGFMTANWYSNQVTNHNLAAQQEADSRLEQRIQKATFAISDPLPVVQFNVTTQRGKFHVVAGAFRQKENAQEKLAQLKANGFQAKYIGENKYGLHEVIYDSYDTRREATNALIKIRSEVNPSAWLLVKEL